MSGKKTKSSSKPGSYIRAGGQCPYCGAYKSSIKQHLAVCKFRASPKASPQASPPITAQQPPANPSPPPGQLAPTTAPAEVTPSPPAAAAPPSEPRTVAELYPEANGPEPIADEPQPDASGADMAALRDMAGTDEPQRPGAPMPPTFNESDLMTLDEWRDFVRTGIADPCNSMDPNHIIAPDMDDKLDAAMIDHIYLMIKHYKPEWLDRTTWAGGEKALVVISFSLLAVSYAGRRYQRFKEMKTAIDAAKAKAEADARAAREPAA